MYKLTIPILLIIILISCTVGPKPEILEPMMLENSELSFDPMFTDSFISINISGFKTDIAAPYPGVAYKGNILILQGYNFPKHDWCEKAPDLCQKARRLGYCLIMPEMGRSVYADSFFIETAEIFKKYPLRSHLRDSLFPYLRKNFNILLPEQNNYVLGLSTGARGAALLVLDYPDFFSAAALLSGDFDQTEMPNDKLMTLFYGAFSKNKHRWKKTDNIINNISEWKTPLYLGHGINDAVVPFSQSQQLFDSLQNILDPKMLKFNKADMGHDYNYWGSETDNILDFFNSKIKI